MKAKAIVIGANGLVGARIGGLLSQKGIEWIGTYNKRQAEGLYKLDITNSAELEKFFSEYSPKVVFNCANLAGGVNFAESNPETAEEFYLTAANNIALNCRKIDAVLVMISTDYIFDGTNPPYKEDDEPNPLNVYGKLRLESEKYIVDNLQRYIIARTTNVYGWDPETVTPNYVMGIYRALKDGKRFNAPSFLLGNPTYAGDLAEAIVELYESNANGIFHIVGSSYVDRFEWAKAVCDILELDASLLDEIVAPPANMVPRPLKSYLNTERFTSSHKTVLHNLVDGLNLMKADMC